MYEYEFNKVLEDQVQICATVLSAKATEYATQDRLHNFKTAGHLQQETPIQALGGMMAKHTVSIFDLIATSESGTTLFEVWNEKITDHINYLILLKALVVEEFGQSDGVIPAAEYTVPDLGDIIRRHGRRVKKNAFDGTDQDGDSL
jgi:hypothetical protein